jgi:hypothetical protein
MVSELRPVTHVTEADNLSGGKSTPTYDRMQTLPEGRIAKIKSSYHPLLRWDLLIIPSQASSLGYLPSGVRTPIQASRTC